jgi:hypothetical protein
MSIDGEGGSEGRLGFGDEFLKDGYSRSTNSFIGLIGLWNHPLRTDWDHRWGSDWDRHVAVAACCDCVSIGRYVWSDTYVVGLASDSRTRSSRRTSIIVERIGW